MIPDVNKYNTYFNNKKEEKTPKKAVVLYESSYQKACKIMGLDGLTFATAASVPKVERLRAQDVNGQTPRERIKQILLSQSQMKHRETTPHTADDLTITVD